MIGKLLIATVLTLLVSTSSAQERPDLSGSWLGVIVLDAADKSAQVPFGLAVRTARGVPSELIIQTSDDRIVVKEIEQHGDSVTFKMPVFISEFTFTAKDDSLVGYYYPKGKGKGISYPFYALKGVTDRFPWHTASPQASIGGRWKYIVNPNTPAADTLVAEFRQQGARFTGTILVPTGDMRFLEGKIAGTKFYMSGFDGGRASVFTADITSASRIENGRMMLSPTYKPAWIAMKDDKAKIAESKDLIRLKKGINTFKFTVKDMGGNTFTSDDPSLKGKVLVVLASGSWCPNCLDETRLYESLYQKYKGKGLAVVSLMFEENDLENSKYRMQRFISQTGATYPFLYAGPRSKKNKDEVLYPVEGVVAFPTSFFIDKKGVIRNVHTGFSGPSTGQHYTNLVEEVTRQIEALLGE